MSTVSSRKFERRGMRFPPHVLDQARIHGFAWYQEAEITPESKYSSLLPWHVNQVREIFTDEELDPSLIVDANAHIGADTWNFSQIYPNADIISIELDPENFRLLQHNTRFAKKHLMRGDALEIIPQLNHIDLLYFDPPWGGRDYKTQDKIDLYLSGQNIGQVVERFLDRASVIVLKTPYNFNEASLPACIMNRYQIMNGEKVSFVLYFMTK